MSEIELPEVDEVCVLRLQPGDTVVVRLKQRLDHEDYVHIKGKIKAWFPKNPVMIVDDDTTIEVLRKEPSNG